jgi:hypothetical protein
MKSTFLNPWSYITAFFAIFVCVFVTFVWNYSSRRVQTEQNHDAEFVQSSMTKVRSQWNKNQE